MLDVLLKNLFHRSMWRYIFSFTIISILTSVIFAVIVPNEGFFEDVLMIGIGVIAIFLLGSDVFIRSLLPTEGETRGINKLLKANPKWKRHLAFVGAGSGFISSTSFSIVSAMTESVFVIGIPIGVFFVCVIFLQYILPKLLPESSISGNDVSVSLQPKQNKTLHTKH